MNNAKSDRDQTALYLFLVKRNTLADVIAAESRALEVLERRTAHFAALAKLLAQAGSAEANHLDPVFGKAPPGGGA